MIRPALSNGAGVSVTTCACATPLRMRSSATTSARTLDSYRGVRSAASTIRAKGIFAASFTAKTGMRTPFEEVLKVLKVLEVLKGFLEHLEHLDYLEDLEHLY